MEHELKSHVILISTSPSLNLAGYQPDARCSNGTLTVYKRLQIPVTVEPGKKVKLTGL